MLRALSKRGNPTNVPAEPPWPSSVCTTSPVVASQILMVVSSDPETTNFPSLDNATDVTGPPWPSSVCTSSPVVASQILMVVSFDPETTDVAQLLWPSSVCKQGLQLSSTIGLAVIHVGSSLLNITRIKL